MKSLMRLRAWAGALFCLMLIPALSAAATWTNSANDLAKAIAAASGPGTITLGVNNASSLPKDQVPEIQRAIEAQLRLSGVRIGSPANANSEVRVTLSENVHEYVWVAEIKQGNNTQVEMVTLPRTTVSVPTNPAQTVTIRKALLLSQPTQILDAVMMEPGNSNSKMLVLDVDALSTYSIRTGKWERDQSWPITHTRPFPRDPRGVITPAKDRAFDVYLPGTVCTANSNAVACRDSDDAWKIGPRGAFYNSGRNYFTGALVPASDKPLGPFYSMAWLEKQNYSLAISTGVDGRVRISDGVNDRALPASLTSDWGSDIAAVKSGCSAGAQLLVTSASEDVNSDSLRAFEIPDRDPVLSSATVYFPGPITALWSHENGSATAIVHNPQTGQYEAYSVSILCN